MCYMNDFNMFIKLNCNNAVVLDIIVTIVDALYTMINNDKLCYPL